MKFTHNLTFENFGKIDTEEFIKLLSSFYFSINGSFKNLENSLKEFKKAKIDIGKNKKKFIEDIMELLILYQDIKINLDISQDKLFYFLKEKLKQKLEDNIKLIMNILKELVIIYLKNLGLDKIFEDINFNKILFTLLFSKFKSGFFLEINSKGINDLMQNLK